MRVSFNQTLVMALALSTCFLVSGAQAQIKGTRAATMPVSTVRLAGLAAPAPATQFAAIYTDALGNLQKTKVTLTDLNFTVISPRDASTGMPTGRRQYMPIIIRAEISAASPLIFQALTMNENFPTIELQCMSATGVLVQTIKLTNAAISSYKQIIGPEGPQKGHILEEVGLSFQKIEVTNVPGKTVAMDDWSTSGA